ncbi:hypothetical protein MD484_g6693, partial [Candolleomyces efflorescens]
MELYAVADFCLIPIGTASSSVAEEIAECQRVLEKSGLKYKACPSRLPSFSRSPATASRSCSGYGTNLEGPWGKVSQAIHDCHAAVHARGVARIATDIRIGTRTDRDILPGDGNDHKVRRVQEILAKGSE